MSLTDVRGFPVALPPLAEQHRIIAMVDELMAICDRLQLGLATEQIESHRLLESILTRTLNGNQARDGNLEVSNG